MTSPLPIAVLHFTPVACPCGPPETLQYRLSLVPLNISLCELSFSSPYPRFGGAVEAGGSHSGGSSGDGLGEGVLRGRGLSMVVGVRTATFSIRCGGVSGGVTNPLCGSPGSGVPYNVCRTWTQLDKGS